MYPAEPLIRPWHGRAMKDVLSAPLIPSSLSNDASASPTTTVLCKPLHISACGYAKQMPPAYGVLYVGTIYGVYMMAPSPWLDLKS